MDKKFVIIPDSSCDLNKELQKRFDIADMVMYSITFPDGTDHLANSDWNEISQKEFYDTMKKPGIYQTGAPSPEKFEAVFTRYLKQGYDVLSFSMSSALTSSYQSASAAANYLRRKFPDRKIFCIDTLRYSTAELPLILKASELQQEGKDIEEVYNYLEEYKYHLHQAGPMDDLFFLAKFKRISNAQAIMGTIAGINPIGENDKTGKTTVLLRVKGWKTAIEASVRYIEKTIINPSEQIIIIANTNRKEKALYFKQLIEQRIKPKEVLLTDVGLSCAPNIGPGLCGAYYYGTKTSDDLSVEKEIYNKILEDLNNEKKVSF